MRVANVQSQVIPRVSVELEDSFRSCICNRTPQLCIDDAPKLQRKRAKITDTDNEEEEAEGKEPQADAEPAAEKEQDKAVDSSDDENTPISNEPE